MMIITATTELLNVLNNHRDITLTNSSGVAYIDASIDSKYYHFTLHYRYDGDWRIEATPDAIFWLRQTARQWVNSQTQEVV